jgi:hypothetical protein
MKHLYILDSGTLSFHWLRDLESSRWLDLLRPFTAVEDLYLSHIFLLNIVPALHGISGEGMADVLSSLQNLSLETPSPLGPVEEGMAEVLPSLQNLFLERPSPLGPVEEVIERSVTALNLASRPIAVSQWDRVHDPWWQHDDR